jgi:hypothetical protein
MKTKTVITAWLVVIILASCASAGTAAPTETAVIPTATSTPVLPTPTITPTPVSESGDYSTAALRIADYLLSQQNADGAIPDAPGWDTVNQDSNMEYALIGLAAAYDYSRDPLYLAALEKGIRWLATREEMIDSLWRGSWFYAYASTPPYSPVPVPLSDDILDARGVDATSALFVYLLYLHSSLSGSNALALEYEVNARAALDFLLANNHSPDGFFYSSWQLWRNDNHWHLWPFRYAADQGDVYLGMQAGWLLYGDARYLQVANHLREQTPARFFDSLNGRYALGLYEDNSMELELEGFNGIFPQGYLAWVFGDNSANQSAYDWLNACVQSDGSLACFPDDPRYSLSAIIYAMSASSLNQPLPTPSLDWLLATAYDSTNGGVRDTADPTSEKFSNVAGFAIVALLQFPSFK